MPAHGGGGRIVAQRDVFLGRLVEEFDDDCGR
jgi:hypothetical protein